MGKLGQWLVSDMGLVKAWRAGEAACCEPPRCHGKIRPQGAQAPPNQGKEQGQALRKAQDDDQGSAEHLQETFRLLFVGRHLQPQMGCSQAQQSPEWTPFLPLLQLHRKQNLPGLGNVP